MKLLQYTLAGAAVALVLALAPDSRANPDSHPKIWNEGEMGRPVPGDIYYSLKAGEDFPIHSVINVIAPRDCDLPGLAQYFICAKDGDVGACVRYCIKPVKAPGCDGFCTDEADLVSWGLNLDSYARKTCEPRHKCVPEGDIPSLTKLERRVGDLETTVSDHGGRLATVEDRMPSGSERLATEDQIPKIPDDLVRERDLKDYVSRSEIKRKFRFSAEASAGGSSDFDGSYRSPLADLTLKLETIGDILGIDLAAEAKIEGGPGAPIYSATDYHEHGLPIATPRGDVEQIHQDSRTRDLWLRATARIKAGLYGIYGYLSGSAGLMKEKQKARDVMPDGIVKPLREVVDWGADYQVEAGVGYEEELFTVESGAAYSSGFDQTRGLFRAMVRIPGMEGVYVGGELGVSDKGKVDGRGTAGWVRYF